jgi:Tfp pilus assembly protein PilF
MVRMFLTTIAVLMSVTAAYSPAAKAQEIKELVRPVVQWTSNFLLNKLVVDGVWDAATGKPDLSQLERQLRELEANAALRSEVQAEVRKLREGLNDRVTREEFGRMVKQTADQIGSILKRLDDLEEKTERLDVEISDLRQGTKNAKDAQFFLKQGRQYEEKKDRFKAVACYNIAINLQPSDANLYCARSRFYVGLGALGVGMIDAAEAIRLDPKHAVAYTYRGRGYLQENDLDRALTDFTEALRLNSKDADAFSHRALAYLRKGDLNGAVLDCWAALGLDGNNQVAHRVAGAIYTQLNILDSAIEEYTAAVRLGANDAEVYFNRGTTYLALRDQNASVHRSAAKTKDEFRKELEKAVERGRENGKLNDLALADLTKSIELDPKQPKAFYYRGVANYNKGGGGEHLVHYDAAYADLTTAIRLDPKHDDSFYLRAQAVRHLGSKLGYGQVRVMAITDLSEAIRLNPNHAKAYRARGQEYEDSTTGKTEKEFETCLQHALSDYSAAIRLDPQYAEAYRSRSHIYWINGDSVRHEADREEAKRLEEASQKK